ncbi:MAG: hypothetical protein IJA91_07330 [Clostridia bacterium]|nr:hypothetical protein [Clostridia bacterium]
MDTNDRYFSTKTNPIRRILMMCIPMAVILVPILIASIGHWIAILGILASAALIFGIIIGIAKKQGWMQIIFRNKTVTLQGHSVMEDMNYFHLEDLEIRDFTFYQSKLQIAKDRGDIKIRGLKFTLENVEKFSETKKYIEENF